MKSELVGIQVKFKKSKIRKPGTIIGSKKVNLIEINASLSVQLSIEIVSQGLNPMTPIIQNQGRSPLKAPTSLHLLYA